jgi:Flp pilus assembly protein TadG
MAVMMKREAHRLRSERGVALAFVALLLFVFLGMAALAVDMGLLYGARTEAQRTADAAALAGASRLFDAPTDAALARSTAIDWAARNPVYGIPPTVLDEDVDVDLNDSLVRVRVVLTEAHQANNPIRNIFGRALGFLTTDVATSAAAQAAVASGINCPLPFVLIDRWWDTGRGGLAEGNDTYGAGDIYNAGPLAREDWPGSPSRNTGFGMADKGRLLRIYPGSTGDSPQPGWYYPLALDGSGANIYRDWIQGCPSPEATFNLGQQIPIEPGRMVGPTTQGFQNLYNQDPNAFWATEAAGYTNAPPPTPGPGGAPGGCVMRETTPPTPPGDMTCVSSPRVKPMLTIDPGNNPPGPGRQTIPLSHFVGVFVECVGSYTPTNCNSNINGNDPTQGVWVRFIEYRGINPMPVGQGDPGSLIRILVLVE